MSAGKYDGATIEVCRWETYNPRMDAKRPTWFRMENGMATSAAFFSLNSDQKWLWIVILSLTSQANGEPITWSTAYISAITGIGEEKQNQALEFFEQSARLRVSRKVTLTNSHATDVRTDETNERDETRPTEFSIQKELKESEIKTRPSPERTTETGIPAEVKAEWEQTLRSVNRAPNWIRDETPIARLYQRARSWDRVKHALAGFRFEKPSNGYEPKLHVHLDRLRDESSFAYLENLGEQGLSGSRRRVVRAEDAAKEVGV